MKKQNIIINNLVKQYNISSPFILDGLTLSVNEGEVYGFIGRNGSGKSTTIKCITGVLPFGGGDVSICGADIVKNAIEAKKHIGYVADNHPAYEEMTGREFVYFMASVYQMTNLDAFTHLVELFELTDSIDQEISSYSHGMRQKICIIACLIHDPDVWILDEPFTGLDVVAVYRLKELIKAQRAKGKTIFLTSHNIQMVEDLCDRVAIIKDGKVSIELDLHDSHWNHQNLEQYFYQIIEIEKDV